jgi:hypothetical protein
MNPLIQVALCLYLCIPTLAQAQAASPKDPLSYPLRTYGLMLAVAILGGFVSWVAKVKTGEVSPGSVFHLIGEITTSAFVGLVTFWVCEYLNLPQIITAPIVGIAGHMGAKAITLIERAAQKKFADKAGLTEAEAAQ